MGLRVLQRSDIGPAELSHEFPRGGWAEELANIKEPGIFPLDDVAFIQAEHGMKVGELIPREAGREEALLHGDSRRRAAPQQGRVPVLGASFGLKYLVPRARGD